MSDKATDEFFELLKEGAEGPLRKATPGMLRDVGITEQGIATKNKNQGVMANTPAIGTIDRKNQRQNAVMPGSAQLGKPKAIDVKLGVGPLFLQDEVHPLALSKKLTTKYGRDWIDWEPETLWETIRDDYSCRVNEENKNKIMAVRVLIGSSLFWTEWEVFEKVVAAFNDRVPIFRMKEDVSLGEIAYTVSVANKIRDRDYGGEIEAFVAAEAFEEGYVKLPEVLSFAQEDLDELSKDTESEKLKSKLGNPLSIVVSDPENPVHIQAGHLQAVHKYVEDKDTENP